MSCACIYTSPKGVEHKAVCHGFFQRSGVVEPSPMVGGHPGGTVAYPIAVIELEDGQVLEVRPGMIRMSHLESFSGPDITPAPEGGGPK